LISSLLQRTPELRLGASAEGAKEIREHPYFEDFDWDGLAGRYLQPPWRPDLAKIRALVQDLDMGAEVEAALRMLDANQFAELFLDEEAYRSQLITVDADERAEKMRWIVEQMDPVAGNLIFPAYVALLDEALLQEQPSESAPAGETPAAAVEEKTYRADNSILQASSGGLAYRVAKDPTAKLSGGGVPWGQNVCGVDEGDGWLRVGDRYIPFQVNDCHVLLPVAGA